MLKKQSGDSIKLQNLWFNKIYVRKLLLKKKKMFLIAITIM